MNPFLLSPKERLDDWKNFRKSLTLLPEDEQIRRVAVYFSQVPLSSIAYDIDAPGTWGTIWEMVSAGNWCRNSVAIAMEATLRLAGWPFDRLCLRYVVHQQMSVAGLVLLLDGAWLMNYEWASITPRPDGLRTLTRYRWNGRGYQVTEAPAI